MLFFKINQFKIIKSLHEVRNEFTIIKSIKNPLI